MGLCAYQLQHWLRFFPPEQIMVLNHEQVWRCGDVEVWRCEGDLLPKVLVCFVALTPHPHPFSSSTHTVSA